MAKSNLKKRTVKPTSIDEDFGRRQLFMHKSKLKSTVVLSSSEHCGEAFSGVIVHDNEQLNVGVITTFNKSEYLPVNGQFKVTLK